jgi:small subunit ribosomal protein S6
MRHYETLYIISPELDDEDYKARVTKHKDLIEKEKGVIVKLDEWGKRKLAYELKKFDQGFYVLMDYCGSTDIAAEVARALKLDDQVLKYQTIKLDDNVNPEDLIKKTEEVKEAEKEATTTEEQVPEGELAAEKEKDVKDEDIKPDQEVGNGIQ